MRYSHRDIVGLFLWGVPCLFFGTLAVVLGLLYWTHPAREGAAAVTLQVTAEESGGEGTPDDGEERLQQAAATVDRAVRQWGVPSPYVSVVDTEARLLRVELPGADPARLIQLMEDRAELEFKLVENELGPFLDPEWIRDRIPEGMETACERVSSAASGKSRPCYLLNASPVIVGADVRQAEPVTDQSGSPAVSVLLTDAAGERLRQFTTAHAGRRLAIVLDGEVVMAPLLQGEISNHSIISGAFSEHEVQDLAMRLQSGRLPVLSLVRAEPISPAHWLRQFRVGFMAAALVFVVSLAGGIVFVARLLRNRPSDV